MARYQASDYKLSHNRRTLDRSATLPDEDSTIEGGACTWVLGTALTAERTITVADFDSARFGEYLQAEKPVVFIKCAVDASANNAVIKDAAGSTLFTFAADYSVTPAYVALRLTSADAWELA